MSEEKKPTSKPKKIIDVAHPGDSAPSPNSKSVIITHRPTIQDPMMNAAEKPADTEDSTEPAAPSDVAHSAHTVLQPLTAPEPAEESEPEVEAEPKTEEPKPAEKPETDAKPPEASGTGTDAKLGTKDIQTEAQMAASDDAETKRQADLQVLVDSKKYYLPINTLETKRTKQFVLVGVLLSLILIIAWADIALDAGLIHIGNLKAVTHFFN